MSGGNDLRVVRAADVRPRPQDQPSWLIEGLWGAEACGVLGGCPKSCKSWLSLEMALAVASGQPCLGRFAAPLRGPALVYAAEDSPVQVRERLEGLSRARGVDFAGLDVHLILEPALRIDRPEDLGRLRTALERLRPRLLVLDPYVRLQSVDENNSTEVSQVLGSLRRLSRSLSVAVVLVHHARKGGAEQAGQALRGSSDFHAWGDSNLYLSRRGEDLTLSFEHRAAPSLPPLGLRLVGDPAPAHLEIRESTATETDSRSLPDRVLAALDPSQPRRQEDLRQALQVRNQRLTEVLHDLERHMRVERKRDGWLRAPQR